MFRYLGKLVRQWVIYLGVIPNLDDIISTFTPFDVSFSFIPITIKYTTALLFLLYGSYSVWKDENNEKLKLEEKLKNPIDYKIIAELRPIEIDENIYLHRLDEYIKKIPNIEKEIDLEIEKNTPKKIEDKTKIYLETFNLNSITNINSEYITAQKIIYLNKLKDYKEELINLIKNYDSIKDKMINGINQYKKNKYYVRFKLVNIGTKYDEDINIQINTDYKILQAYDIKEYRKYLPKYPIKPEEQKNDIFALPPSELSNDIFNRINSMETIYTPKISDNSISVLIQNIYADCEKYITNDLLFLDLSDKKNMNFIIKSKGLSSVIKKEVEIVFLEKVKTIG